MPILKELKDRWWRGPIIAINSRHIKVTKRGQCLDERKRNVQNRKGHFKNYVAVDLKRKKLCLSLEATYEKIHDSMVLKVLVSHVLDNHDKKKIKSVVADGAHDINRNFRRLLEDKKIILGIKLRSNSIVSYKTKKLRNQKSRLQTKYLLEWKKRRYGYRWINRWMNLHNYQKNMLGIYPSH